MRRRGGYEEGGGPEVDWIMRLCEAVPGMVLDAGGRVG